MKSVRKVAKLRKINYQIILNSYLHIDNKDICCLIISNLMTQRKLIIRFRFYRNGMLLVF